MRLFVLPALVLALLGSGCKTATKPVAAPPPEILGGFTVVEKSTAFYEGQPRIIPPETYRARVDYESELRIIVDTNRLNLGATKAESVLPKLSAEEKARLDRLSELLQAVRRYVQAFETFSRKYEELRNAPTTPENQKILTDLIRAQGRAETNYLQPLIEYVDAKTRAQNPNFTRSQVIQARDLVRSPSNKPLIAPGQDNFAVLSEFIAAESAAVIRQASLDARSVKGAGSYLRMRATIFQGGSPGVPLHIRNYDTMADADVVQEPRISFQMSEEDRKRIAAQNKVNTELAHLIGDVQKSKSDIRQSLDGLLTAVRGDLKEWKQAVGNLDSLKEKIGPVIAALDKAGASSKLSEAQKQVLTDATNAFRNATNGIRQIRDVINQFTSVSNPDADPAETLLAAMDKLSTGLDTILRLPQNLSTNISVTFEHLQILLNEIKDVVPQDAPNLQDLADALKAGAPTSFEEVAKLLEVGLKNYPNLIAELKSLRRKTQIVAADAALAPIQTDPDLIDVELTSPPDGFISLARNVARGGVTIGIDAAVVNRKDSNTPPTVKNIAHQEFGVEKFGLVNTWSANLILVKRLGNLGSNDREVQFSPAPSISWTLHYNPPPNPAAANQAPNKLWDTFYPGVGFNVAALSWDNGVQMGLGGHVSFLHDILSVGGGWNLNESGKGGYVFIGLGLFETFNRLGLTGSNFPLGR